ncbi:MAG: T9SS type A sorting domain-containing protein, partial [Candidatus Glassbacteria bacterium]|nr:T9SS type A sorting domain-containing protein [Candidatus Glassbacteria bacterium]
VGAVEVEKYGETELTGIMITLVNNADHDWLEPEGVAYTLIDQFRLSGAALDIDDFLPPEEEEGPGPTGPVCDFNGDGKIIINDVIAYLLYGRDNPTDLARLDWNGDGKYLINDAIMFLNHIQKGTCPDAALQLSSAVDEIQAVRMEGMSQSDLEYLEELMSQMKLTEEQEAAFRLALYGQAGRAELPKANTLSQNSPNPFNPATTISYTIAEGSTVYVTLNVYDIRGNLVRSLVNEAREAGTYNVFWDGTDEGGRSVSSGVYFYRIKAGDFNQTRKMVLLK